MCSSSLKEQEVILGLGSWNNLPTEETNLELKRGLDDEREL